MRIQKPIGDGSRRSLSRVLWRNLDSLPSPAQIERLIARETARAERNGLHFSLCLFRVRRGGRVRLSERRLALTLLRRARLTDEVGWFSDDYLCAMLPDTSPAGARIFADSVCELVARKGPRPATVVYSYPECLADDRQSQQDQPPHDGNGHNGHHSDRRQDAAAQQDSVRQAADEAMAALGGVRAAGRLGLGAAGDEASAAHRPEGHGGHTGPNGHNGHNGHAAIGRGDLLPFVAKGMNVALAEPRIAATKPRPAAPPATAPAPGTEDDAVQPLQSLLVRPMPAWKRAIDVACAGALLVGLSPVLAAAALAVRLTSAGPAIFKQRRAGLGGRPFTIYKFRTMCADAEAKQRALRQFNEQDGPAFKLARDPRITAVGAILRKTSLDELPQLWNVIKGDMSLVGPRPLPLHESDGCEVWQRRRLDVTPGLTCIWQIEGRNEVSFAEWVRMDVSYMRRRTILHDLSILFRTIPAVLMRRGAR